MGNVWSVGGRQETSADLAIVEGGGEVTRDGLDDVAHGEAAGMEHRVDCGPVALEVAPGRQGAWVQCIVNSVRCLMNSVTCWVGRHGRQD